MYIKFLIDIVAVQLYQILPMDQFGNTGVHA